MDSHCSAGDKSDRERQPEDVSTYRGIRRVLYHVNEHFHLGGGSLLPLAFK